MPAHEFETFSIRLNDSVFFQTWLRVQIERLTELMQAYNLLCDALYTHADSDVIFSSHIYASCFPAVMWGKLTLSLESTS